MRNKITLIGLPGTGKSTTAQECCELMQKKGFSCVLKSTDEIIRDRFKQDDPVILQFQEKIGKTIPVEVFTAKKPASAFMMEFGEEPLYRDLEEMFIKDIVQSSAHSDWLDLGGKAPLRDGAINFLRNKKVTPIFLYAQHETIVARLANGDNWKVRSNYLNAGEEGWKELAKMHRIERLMKYCDAAPIIINVESENSNGVRLKTSKELAHEIFFRVRELELICHSRNNIFINSNRQLFSPEVASHHIDLSM